MAPVKGSDGGSAGITKAEFAYRLRYWMKSFKYRNKWLAQKMGKDAATISHYKSADDRWGVPSEEIRRELEQWLTMPKLTLDGRGDIEELVRARRGLGEEAAEPAPFSAGGEEWPDEPFDRWLFRDDAPERFDSYLRLLDRTGVRLADNRDFFTEETKFLIQRALIKAAYHAHNEQGVAIPSWLDDRRQRVLDGTYR